MSDAEKAERISLEPLMNELERLIEQIRDQPHGPRGLQLEALKDFEELLGRIRKRYHINTGPLSYFIVPP